MILPNYKMKVLSQTPTQLFCKLSFDKIEVFLSGDAKYSKLEIKITIKDGCRRRNVCLLEYLVLISAFLESNTYICKYNNKNIDLLDLNLVRFLEIEGLKITSGEIEFIKNNLHNLFSLITRKCTIYDKANMGLLSCIYTDYESYITSLDSFNGFSGRKLYFYNSKIINNNKRLLHLYNVVLKFENVDIDYEAFILMLDAQNLRKLDIITKRKNQLSNDDLLFISGLYNLESINITSSVNSLQQIKKLERLREIRGVLLCDYDEMEKIKLRNKKYYDIMKQNGASDEQLSGYLMYHAMHQFDKYLDLLNRLYVNRLERVKWENKINANDVEKIKEELIKISKMSYEERNNIAREIKEFTLQDQLDGLWFDKLPTEDEEYILTNSSPNPFDIDGIDYYAKSKKIMLL